MLGPGAAAWLGALSVLTPSEAPASGVRLEWSAPARCPTASAVQERLARALADSAADPGGLRARASVTEGEGGVLTLVLELERDDGPVGQRTLQASDCNELATAAVLIVALAVDPDAAIEDPVVEPAPADEQVPEPGDDGAVPPVPSELGDPAEPQPSVSEPEPQTDSERPPTTPARPEQPLGRQRRVLHAGLRLGAGAGFSVLSHASAVVSAGAAVWGRAFRVELGASYWTPVEARPDDTAAGGRLQQWTIDARGCGLLRPGPLELPLCGGLDVGAVHGVGVGVASPQRVASLRLAFAAGAALVWRPARWKQRVGPWIGADLLVALVRARFRATPAAPGLVHHTPPVGGRVAAGIEVRFR
jgi:hypothetical protein